MLIKSSKGEIIIVAAGKRIIAFIAKGAQVLWQAVRSCFGGGCWRDDKSWNDKECWKD
jgi:hypothetical protein